MALITSHRVGVAGRDGKDGDGGFFERVQGKGRGGRGASGVRPSMK